MSLGVLHVVLLSSVASALRVGVGVPHLQATQRLAATAINRDVCVLSARGSAGRAASPACLLSCASSGPGAMREPATFLRTHGGNRRNTRSGATAVRMQQMDEGAGGTLGRRQMVSIAAAALAGCVLSAPQDAAAETALTPAWRPVYGTNGKPQYLGFKQAEETYPLYFIEYLTRILLNFDETSREVFKEDAEPLSVLPKDKRQEKRFEQFARFSASVEFGLRSYNGTQGAAKLARVLVARYGRNNPSALLQLGFLFTLMDNGQPVQEIERIMARYENATVDSILVQDGGAGYTGDVPRVFITDTYGPRVQAEATCSMRETGRLLTVRIRTGGAGYNTPPKVSFPGLASAVEKDMNAAASDIEFKAPQAEAILKDGKVVAVQLKSRGTGLVSSGLSSLRVAFLPVEGDLPLANAEGYAVLDRKVDAIKMKNAGVGYQSMRPPSVLIESPGECGGDKELGKSARASVKMKRGTRVLGGNKGGSGLSKTSMFVDPSSMFVGPKIEDEDINLFIKLYPSSVAIVYSNSSKRYLFSETSMLGFNITTPFGPISQYSRRTPISEEIFLDSSVYFRLAAAGAICASIAHGLLVPLDTVKTRLQTAPKGTYNGALDACIKVFRDEGGVSVLLRGLQPEVVGFSIYGAFSFGGTEFCRRWVAALVGPEGALLYPIPILMLGSAMASLIAVVFTCPFMAVKTRLIADESFAGGSLIKGMNRIITEEEWQSSLFGGLVPLMLKDVLFVLSKFVIFDLIKTSIFFYFPEAYDSLSSTLFVSLLSGSLAGMVSAVTSQPGDYLFSKSSASASANLGSAWATYWSNARSTGQWSEILTGLPPRIVFSGALTALQFVIYDYCRVQFHVSPNELMTFLDVMASVGPTSS